MDELRWTGWLANLVVRRGWGEGDRGVGLLNNKLFIGDIFLSTQIKKSTKIKIQSNKKSAKIKIKSRKN